MEGAEGGPGPTPRPYCALQGRACRLQGKDDAQDFARLLSALQVLGLSPEELTTVWALLASVLQLGNICFSSSEVGFPYGLGHPRKQTDPHCSHEKVALVLLYLPNTSSTQKKSTWH